MEKYDYSESYNSLILYISVIFPLGSFRSDLFLFVIFLFVCLSLAFLHFLPSQSVLNKTVFSDGQKCHFLLQPRFRTAILNNINDVLFDDCFTLSAASGGTRHLGFPCKSAAAIKFSAGKFKSLLKTLTSSAFNFLLLRVYS